MPRKDDSLFSQDALEALRRGADTGSLTNIISNWTWFMLAAVSIALGAVLYWGFFGSMADTVEGVGVTVNRGGMETVVARGSGFIDTLSITPGMTVERDDIVGHVYNPHDFLSLSKLELEYEQLCLYLDSLEEGALSMTALTRESAAQKEAELQSMREKFEANRLRSLEISEIYRKAEANQAIAKLDFYRALEQTLEVESSLSSLLQQYLDSSLNRSGLEWEDRKLLIQGRRDRQRKEQELLLAKEIFHEFSWLRTGAEGTVIEVFKDIGDYVSEGDSIALIGANKSSDLLVIGYVPLEVGKKVQPGMSVLFSPSSFDPKEYGYIRGVVLETSPFAVSTASIEAELKNSDLAKSITRRTVQMRVVVELLPSATIAGDYKWTSRQGTSARIDSGSYGTLSINTQNRAPASYVIPFFRRSFDSSVNARASASGASMEGVVR